MDIKKFLSAFYAENDNVCIRVFSDRKAEDPEFKGQKYTDKLSNIENIMPMLICVQQKGTRRLPK